MKRTASFTARDLNELGYSDDSIVPVARMYTVTRTGRDGTVVYLDRGGWYHLKCDSACHFCDPTEARRAIMTAAAGCAA